LVAQCKLDDEAAWTELVQRFARYVHAIAVTGYRLTETEAEDVFQEVFTRTYEQLERLRDEGAIRPWLAQLTRRLSVDRLRARAREVPGAGLPERGQEDATLEQLAEALEVHAALRSLPEPCGEILDRFFARDESYRTISAALGIPSGTIASRISRCLRKLRVYLEASLEEPPSEVATPEAATAPGRERP
jgi:RNA polymerase sigma-70 factor (ECF subfamily)